MRYITAIILLVAVAQAHGSEDSMDKSTVKVSDGLIDRVSSVVSHDANLDQTTVGKTSGNAMVRTAPASATAVARPLTSFRGPLSPLRGPLSTCPPVCLPTFQAPLAPITTAPRGDLIVSQVMSNNANTRRSVRVQRRNRVKNKRWLRAIRETRKYAKKLAVKEGYTAKLEIICRRCEGYVRRAQTKGVIKKSLEKKLQSRIYNIRDTRNYPPEQVAAAQPGLKEYAEQQAKIKAKRIAKMEENIKKKREAAKTMA